jgi:hypothetical protein
LLLGVGVENAESVDICKGDNPGGDIGEILIDKHGELSPRVLVAGGLNGKAPESELDEEFLSCL